VGATSADENAVQAEAAPVPAVVPSSSERIVGEFVVPAPAEALYTATAWAGLVGGLAVKNQTSASVAVAIEFGRAGSGWATGIVFNIWLRRQLRIRRMSQRQLAVLAGVDHSTISRLLRRTTSPSLTTATKLVRGLRLAQDEGAEPDTAEYFERIPQETVFPARQVEHALRADELLDDDQVRRVMMIYLEARRRPQASAPSPSAPTRAGPPPTGLEPAVLRRTDRRRVRP
jgi:transcriptional regulator with XRE-family HTH domain